MKEPYASSPVFFLIMCEGAGVTVIFVWSSSPSLEAARKPLLRDRPKGK